MAAVAEEVARLDALSLGELRTRWVKLTDSPAPKVGTNMLRLALAWEIQASAYGGLPRGTTQAGAVSLTRTALHKMHFA